MATRRVRIAVAIADDGAWAAAGNSSDRQEHSVEEADDALESIRRWKKMPNGGSVGMTQAPPAAISKYWVEADLDIPETITVPGNANPFQG
jgi:hypothetical protein